MGFLGDEILENEKGEHEPSFQPKYLKKKKGKMIFIVTSLVGEGREGTGLAHGMRVIKDHRSAVMVEFLQK